APVHVHDRYAVRCQLGGEEFQAEINDAWSSREQCWQAGWDSARPGLVVEHISLLAFHGQWLCRVVWRLCPQHCSRRTYGLGVTVCEDHALITQELTLRFNPLRILWSTTDMRNSHQRSPRCLGRGLRFLPRGGQSPGRVWMRTPAEHHIAQHHRDRRMV